MRLFFINKPAHPRWGRFSGRRSPVYSSDEKGIHAVFGKDAVLPHYNHIETSGFGCSAISNYLVTRSGHFRRYVFAVFPAERMYPDYTRSSFSCRVKGLKFGSGKVVAERVDFDGILSLTGSVGGIRITEQSVAAAELEAVVFRYRLENKSGEAITVTVKTPKGVRTPGCFAMDGKARIVVCAAYFNGRKLNGKDSLRLEAGGIAEILYSAGIDAPDAAGISAEFDKRIKFVKESDARLRIVTPERQFDEMARFCKIRASESIFATPNGLMHSPGGGNFYGAMWTNDECEYVNPLFAYLGYDKAREQSVNCYQLFGRLAKTDEAIYTSIIACGNGYWHGAKDRGDNAMYLYGLSRYLLTTGDRERALGFLPYIETALNYQLSKFTEDDVLLSDSDELENRFLSGNANLSTQCIAYDAFVSLKYLFGELQRPDLAEKVGNAAERVKRGIKKRFEADVEGFATYRYCDEENRLRSWICLPLTVGIYDRQKGTVDALTSDKLSRDGGIVTRSGEKTYWDRSALYAIKGLFSAQETSKAYAMLRDYTEARLKGEHAPYPREAYPEGNAAHLSAESGLYLRIFVEGILGYRPTGFSSFILRPALPDKWNSVEVGNIYLCGRTTDISVKKEGERYRIAVGGQEYVAEKGKAAEMTLGRE